MSPWGARGAGAQASCRVPALTLCRPQESHQRTEEGEAGVKGARLRPQLQEGPSVYGRTWFGVRTPAGVQQANRGIVRC